MRIEIAELLEAAKKYAKAVRSQSELDGSEEKVLDALQELKVAALKYEMESLRSSFG